MKLRLLLIIIGNMISLGSYAISYEVIGPCSSNPVHSGNFNINNSNTTAGTASVMIFDKNKIPYVGTESGFSSIVNTPTGIDSIEVISDTKMRAYGWCYSVNDVEPSVVPSEYLLASNNDKLSWFYAYSTYDNGVWLDYCVPSHKIKAPQFCSK